MKASGIAGIVLIILGVIALTVGTISFTREREVLDVGPIEATVEDRETVPIPAIVGIVAIGAGVLLLIAGRRKA
jgi:uncharacterized membrane protein HdeD (DUF308 family)